MINYAVVEISGRQYKITPDQEILVDFLGDLKNFECEKVLVLSENNKLTLGSPFIKTKLKFDVLETVKQPKIRVAKYHSKANTRKVTGSKPLKSKIKLVS